MFKQFDRVIISVLTVGLLLILVLPVAAQTQRADSLSRNQAQPSTELRGRMMSSPLPVSIRQQGRQICVQSRYNQLLPVYTESGTFYTAFRLCKGTNWLTGLPKGTYLINNRKFTIY